jgi:nucleoid DNA-binding protein
MRTRQIMTLGALLGACGLALILSAPAQTERPRVDSLVARIAEATKLSEENTDRFLKAMGPAIRDELKQGKEVSLPGLGTFRVVQIQEHKDLRGGDVVVIPTTNTVEFVPEGTLVEATNSSTAQPAETVPAFRYIPVPGQTPSNRVSRTRTLPMRTR